LASSLRLAGTGAQEPSWDRLRALAMPVLVVAGEHDEKFRALGERVAAAIGANARFETVPGAGHPAHLERPDAFAEQVERFLAST
jgi:pimeloyl-ACP methyl ester carboxylesterase